MTLTPNKRITQPMKAQAIIGSIDVLASYNIERHSEVEVGCDNYDVYAKLPAAITYSGKVYGKKGWSSDKNRAYYDTDKSFAMAF